MSAHAVPWWKLGALVCILFLPSWLPPAYSQTANQQKEFQDSYRYYQKRAKQGAHRNELMDILYRMITKYDKTGLDISKVHGEFVKLKTQGTNGSPPAPSKPDPTRKKNGAITNGHSISRQSGDSNPTFAKIAQDLEMRRREFAIGEKIRSDLEETLSQYFPANSYLITVDTTLERIRPARATQAMSGGMGGTQLPGLPIDSPYIASPEDTPPTDVDTSSWEQVFRLKWLKIVMLLQEKMFKPEDKAFLSNVVKMKSGFDELRGDQMQLKELPFPKLARAIADNPPPPPSSLNAPRDESGARRQIPTDTVWTVAIACAALALIFGVMLLRRPPAGGMPSMSAPAYAVAAPPLPALGFSPASSAPAHRLHDELRQLTAVATIGDPSLAARILSRWSETSPREHGVGQIANFLAATDPKLIQILRDEWPESLALELEVALSKTTAPSPEAAEVLLKKFREDFQQTQQAEWLRYGPNRDRDIFLFLRRLGPHQVVKILEDEEPGVVAVALAQLPPDATARILKQLPPDRRSRIPGEMGKLDRIPASAFYEIAERLSKKALDVSDIKYVTTDGAQALLSVLEEVDAATERELLMAVQQQNINLAMKLRQTHITYADLSRLSASFLSEYLRGLDREFLARLMAAAPELAPKFLPALPERLRLMVEEMSQRYHDLSVDERDQIKRQFLTELRQLAKTGKMTVAHMLEDTRTTR